MCASACCRRAHGGLEQGRLGELAAQVTEDGDRPDAWGQIGEGFVEDAFGVGGSLGLACSQRGEYGHVRGKCRRASP